MVITATDTAGNTTIIKDATPTEITSGDTEVPEKPVITSVTNSFDEQGDVLGTAIKGTTSSGAWVQLYDEQGELLGEVKANLNGNFEITTSPALTHAESYTVSAKYELGNSSPAVTVVGDTAAPNVDTIKIVQLDTSDPADGAANQTLLTFNTDEPDAKFAFRYVDAQDGETKAYAGEVTYSAQGNTISVTFMEPPLEAGDKIIIIGTDSYGNTSDTVSNDAVVPDEVTAVGDDTPPKLTEVSLEEVTGDDGELTKHTFSFTTNDQTATYIVTVNGEKHTGEPVITGEEGSQTYTYTFEPPLKAGAKVKVEATDPAGNTSDASATAEIFLNITSTEQWDADIPADGKADKTIVKFVANNHEPDTFSAINTEGKKIDVTVTRLRKAEGEDEETAPWQYEVTFEPALAEGEKVFIVGKLEGLDEVVKEAAAPDSITDFADKEAPDTPEVDGFTNNKDDNSTTVTGTAEAGSTVKIIDPDTDKVVGSGTVGDDGKFEIFVEDGLANGQNYNVTATDKAGNTSDPTPVTGDTTAPEKLADDAIKIGNNGDEWIDEWINADEITEGTVTVVIELPKDAEDKVLTEVGDILVVNGEEIEITQEHIDAGTVELELDAPKEGEELTVDAFLKDEHNNASEKVAASAKVDTEAPAKPVIDSVEDNGDITGHTESGATITDTDGNPLKDADDNDIVADAEGKFTIPSGRVPDDGIIKAKDAAGNQSEPVNVFKLPGIEHGFDNVASVDEDGNVTEYINDADHDQFSNNGFTNDATPYFEIPAGVTGLNDTVLIITQNGISTAVAAI
ncbi:MAG: hypothetical protein GX853_10640, partial [Chloroflexi bacterium]|nr:hypothetical protein [Chloroflexota bacterium]